MRVRCKTRPGKELFGARGKRGPRTAAQCANIRLSKAIIRLYICVYENYRLLHKALFQIYLKYNKFINSLFTHNMYCSSLNRISKLSAYCSILYLSDFFYYNICTLRYLNIIYTMNYFSCIWKSPGHFTDSKCWRFSWLFIFVEIVDLNFNIQLNYTYCQEERCFTIHATPLTNLKYNSLNLRSIY